MSDPAPVVWLELPRRCPRCLLSRAWFRLAERRVRGSLQAEEVACECGWRARVYWRSVRARHADVRRWQRIAAALVRRPSPPAL